MVGATILVDKQIAHCNNRIWDMRDGVVLLHHSESRTFVLLQLSGDGIAGDCDAPYLFVFLVLPLKTL